MNENKTPLIDPKDRKFTSHNIKQGQVLEIDDKKYVVVIIGAMWVDDGENEYLDGRANIAILANLLNPNEYFNLRLHPYGAGDDAQMPNPVFIYPPEDDREDISEEHKEKLRNTPINIIEHGERTLLQNLLFSVHSHPMEGLGIIYHEIDLERVCDHMHKALQEEIKGLKKTEEEKSLVAGETPYNDATWAHLWHLMGMDQVFSEMKAFFTHKT